MNANAGPSTHAYAGRCRKCERVVSLCVDLLENANDCAEAVAESIRDGQYIERVTIEQARASGPWCTCHMEGGAQ